MLIVDCMSRHNFTKYYFAFKLFKGPYVTYDLAGRNGFNRVQFLKFNLKLEEQMNIFKTGNRSFTGLEKSNNAEKVPALSFCTVQPF
jgi:hypothetical protein